MPNRDTHLKAGIISGSILGAISSKSNESFWPDVLLSAIGGAIGGLMPDFIEPAYGPYHRQILHSKIILIGNFYGINKTENAVVKGILSGYASHLLLDTQTPMGLPDF